MDYKEIIQQEAFRRYPIVETNHPTQERDLELKRKAYINGINSPLAKQITEIEVVKGKIEALKLASVCPLEYDGDSYSYIIDLMKQEEQVRDKLINELKIPTS